MRTTIDSAGRLVVPKRIRERLGLKGGEPLEIEESDGRIEISHAVRESDLVETEHGLLTMEGGPGLDPEQVRELLERTRR